MTIIKASCPTCGDVELTRDAVRLVVHPIADRSFYSFSCSGCGVDVRKPAGERVVKLLTMGGVAVETVDVPAEALVEHVGPRITADEVLDFASWLDGVDNIVEAASAGLYNRP